MNLKLQVEQLTDYKRQVEELPAIHQELEDVRLQADEVPTLKAQVR